MTIFNIIQVKHSNIIWRRNNIYFRLNPEYDQAMNNLGNILKDKNELEEAEELLSKAVAIRYFMWCWHVGI